MADALCGPSNALQNFKRHTQVDRSLQQDRLTGHRTPVQSFRSHDPRAGSLDAEFHAFENASPSPFQESIASTSFVPQPQLFQQPPPVSWANDFQQLSIADQPLPAQQFRNAAPLVRSTNGGWQNEFVRQQQSGQNSVTQGKQAVYEQQPTSAYGPQMHYQGSFAPVQSSFPQLGAQQFSEASQMQSADQFAGAEWSQAFEEAFQDAFKDAEQTKQSSAVEESTTLHEDGIYTDDHSVSKEQGEQIRIGSDAIDYVEMKDRTIDQEGQDASALARVAGELLHNVQHDSSEKFQNSQFLDLMRKIRDRQVEVRGNEFEETTHGTAQSILQPTQGTATTVDQDIRNAPDPLQNDEVFAFPNMNAVYAPHEGDFVDYTFDSDQFPTQPRNQISDLHPGGKLYPEQAPDGLNPQMSGAVSANNQPLGTAISADDFEAVYDENRNLASRYLRPAA